MLLASDRIRNPSVPEDLGIAVFQTPDEPFGGVAPGERAVLYNCATGLKYPMPPVTRSLGRTGAIDFAAL